MKKRCLLTKTNSKGTLIGEREREREREREGEKERESVYWDGGAKSSHYTKILLKKFSLQRKENIIVDNFKVSR